jgi:hypothetical protein
MKKFFTIILLLLSFTSSSFLSATTCTWTGAGDGTYWFDANNWDCGSVPSAGDNAIVGTLPDGTAPTITTNNSSGGSASVQIYSLTVNSAAIFNFGNRVEFFGTTNINAAATINIEADGINGGFIKFNVNATGAKLVIKGNTDFVNNNGLFIYSIINITRATASTAKFINNGTIQTHLVASSIISATTKMNVDIPIINPTTGNVSFLDGSPAQVNFTKGFDNSGTIYVDGYNYGGFFFRGGTINLNAGSTLSLSSPTGGFAGFYNATVNLNSDFNIPSKGRSEIAGSIIQGSSTINVLGSNSVLDLYAPTLDVDVTSVGRLVFNNYGSGVMSIKKNFTSDGTITWATQHDIDLSGTFTNNGIMNLTSASNLTNAGGTFINNGTINANTGANCIISPRTTLNANKTVNVNAGFLQFKSYDNRGISNIASGATLVLGGANNLHFFQSTATTTGTGNLVFELGNHQMDQNYSTGGLLVSCVNGFYFSGSGRVFVSNNGNLSWGHGWFTIPININAGGTVTMSGAGLEHRITNLLTVFGTLNWQSGIFSKSNVTEIYIPTGGVFNINTADGFSSGYEGLLTNYGTINYSTTSTNTLSVSMRTYNSPTGVINVINLGPTSQLALTSYQNDGSLTVQTNSWLILGGENLFHIQNGTITGTGFLAFSLGNHNLPKDFSSGSIARILCFNGYYFSGSGVSITTTTTTNLRLIGGWTTIPIIINGFSDLYQNPRTTNTITVNGTLDWRTAGVSFGTNGKISISAGAQMLLNTAGSTTFDAGATNFGITNCGTIICNADVNFTVPYTNCATSKVKGIAKLFSATGHVISSASPGASPGTLTLNPFVTSATNAIYDMEVTGGYGAPGTADDADMLVSTGNIALDGTLNIILYNAQAGTYPLIDGATTTGNFTSVQYSLNGGPFTPNPPIGALLAFDPAQGTVTLTLAVALSAELTSFKGKITDNGNLLTWQSASEVNTDNFDIERSTDGQQFDKIGTIKAQGKAATYDFLDKGGPLSITTYYRLKINDLDKKSAYSKVITLAPKAKGLTAKAYPNPAHDVLTVDIEVEKKSDLTIELRDILGRLIWASNALYTEGSLSLPIPLTGVVNGNYFLKVSNGLTTIQQKIVKN